MKKQIYFIDVIANNQFNSTTNTYDYSLGDILQHYEIKTKYPYLKLKRIMRKNKNNNLIYSIIIKPKNSHYSIELLHKNNSYITNNKFTIKQNIKALFN